MREYIAKDVVLSEINDNTPFTGTDREEYILANVIEIVRNTPAADVEPVRKWISCSERLPDHGGSYLVCTNKSKVFMAHFYTPDKFSGKATIAYWMELPEPPKMDGGSE